MTNYSKKQLAAIFDRDEKSIRRAIAKLCQDQTFGCDNGELKPEFYTVGDRGEKFYHIDIQEALSQYFHKRSMSESLEAYEASQDEALTAIEADQRAIATAVLLDGAKDIEPDGSSSFARMDQLAEEYLADKPPSSSIVLHEQKPVEISKTTKEYFGSNLASVELPAFDLVGLNADSYLDHLFAQRQQIQQQKNQVEQQLDAVEDQIKDVKRVVKTTERYNRDLQIDAQTTLTLKKQDLQAAQEAG